MNTSELLEKYNPILITLPADVLRHRPWNRFYQVVRRLRGDYQPCSAEFFLSFVAQTRRKKTWSPASVTAPSLPEPTGLPGLRAMVETATRDDIAEWELDIATIKSQEPDQAWAAYGMMLERERNLRGPVVYGRCFPGPPVVLQYWYLYVYNDAPNKHEGDWEMVQFVMKDVADGDPVPDRAGYAGHAGGFWRTWQDVETQDGRPVVYVARGSHAAYFDHDPNGHRTNSLASRKGFPEPIDSLWNRLVLTIQDVAVFLRLQDRTAPNPRLEPDNPERGEQLALRLLVLPDHADLAQYPEFWWMRIDCAWGSSHARFFGSAAPPPPWRQNPKWDNPPLWMENLTPSPKT